MAAVHMCSLFYASLITHLAKCSVIKTQKLPKRCIELSGKLHRKYSRYGCNLCRPMCHSYRTFSTTYTAFKRRKTAEEKKAISFPVKPTIKQGEVILIWKGITVRQLAESMKRDLDDVFEIMLYVQGSEVYDRPNRVITDDRIVLEIVKKAGLRCKIIARPSKVTKPIKEEPDFDVSRRPPADPSTLVKRAPVVTIMGHVDHGKTTLLDKLRNTRVVDAEFGGITQHIGAFSVKLGKDTITFLDTPGHAAFSAMRARGAQATDIIVLVVAAEDGVMPQTVESIELAKEAKVPVIVAINKIDKPGCNIEICKKMLLEQGIQLEDFGGEIQSIPISALKSINLDLLVEAIILQSELMQLKGDCNGMVEGVVIESRTDPHRGKLSTAIIQRGILSKGKVLVSGTSWAKVRGMFNDQGQLVETASLSDPIEIIGWRNLPSAGDDILEVTSEKIAQKIVEVRRSKLEEQKMKADEKAITQKTKQHLDVYKAALEEKRLAGFYKIRRKGPREKEITEDTFPRVSIVLKCDVDGSTEALLNVLDTYDQEDYCKLDMINYGTGTITETDIEYAEAFQGIVYGFNVVVSKPIEELAKSKNVTIKIFNVIYHLIDDLKEEISKCLPYKESDEVIGEGLVQQEFIINEGRRKVSIAGCRCTKGLMKKSALVRLKRNNELVYEGSLKSMRHLKNEVDTVKKDVECGLKLSDENIQVSPGDIIECLEKVTLPQKTQWNPGF